MGGASADGVARDAVINVLRENGVTVQDKGNGKYLIAKGEFVEVSTLDTIVGRKLIAHLANRLGIETHRFWHHGVGQAATVLKIVPKKQAG